VVTTEKDAVRFPSRIPGVDKLEVPIYFLRVEIDIISGHESWNRLIARFAENPPIMEPERFIA
jgi:tetraacyldisaccharide 4'-kinase